MKFEFYQDKEGNAYELKTDLEQLLVHDMSEQGEEIERLNNIINELNYGIKELDEMFYETFRISQNGYYSISEWELKDFTNKLQKLKGSSNNE